MLSYFIIGATIIIPFIGLIMIARTLGTDYKYRDLGDNDEPLVIHGQGDYRKELRPSDLRALIYTAPEDNVERLEEIMEQRIQDEQEFPLDRED